MDQIAWGEVEMKFAKSKTDETMPTALETIGDILEDSLGLETEDGTKYQLFKEGHVLKRELQGEPTLKVTATIIDIPENIKRAFWDIEKIGTGDNQKIAVKSLINQDLFAIQFAAVKSPGSKTFEAPVCSVNLSPLFSSTQGWTSNVEITLYLGKTGRLFQFGVVPAKNQTPAT